MRSKPKKTFSQAEKKLTREERNERVRAEKTASYKAFVELGDYFAKVAHEEGR